MEKRIKYIIIAICIIPLVFLFTYNAYKPSHLCTLYDDFKKLDYHGVVLDKYIDEENHRTRTVVLELNKGKFNLILPRDTSLFYKTVMVGDTLIKRMGDEFIAVQHNDSLLKFKLTWGCE